MSASGRPGLSVPTRNNPKTSREEVVSIVCGAVATACIGLPLTYHAFNQVRDVISQLGLILAAAYVAALIVQFWRSKIDADGMSLREVAYTLWWPLDVLAKFRHGRRAMGDKLSVKHRRSKGTGAKVLPRRAARVLGFVATIIALPLIFSGLKAAFFQFFPLVWIGILVWIIGAFVCFWVSRSYKDGLTAQKLLADASWPARVRTAIRKDDKARRLAD